MQVKDLIVTGDAKIIGNLKANINSQEATQTNSGMMSASDKAKLDGITASADAVSFAQSITSGTQIGTITINGNATGIYAPTAQGGPSYSNATTTTDGLMSAADKSKLDGIATGANKYTHPSYTAKSNGFYKVTVDASGHVSGTAAVTKSDITGLGIPAQDTTYTLSSFGITATAAELNKLDGVTATTAELNYVDGVTSNIQTQLNNKANSSTVSSHTSNKSNPHGVTASQVGARPDTWIPTASDVGAVPKSRTVNGKALSSNISLSASDVGAVPTSRTVNGKALSSNISLSASDVGAIQRTLLWTNDNLDEFPGGPNSKAIISDIQSYKGIEILFTIPYSDEEDGIKSSGFLPIYTSEFGFPYFLLDCVKMDYDGSVIFYSRNGGIYSLGVLFNDAFKYAVGDERRLKDNSKCIPYRIYGIK